MADGHTSCAEVVPRASTPFDEAMPKTSTPSFVDGSFFDQAGRPKRLSMAGFVPQRFTAGLNRRYEVLGEVGCGGFGKVFRAEDREVAGRTVAVKRVRITDEDSKRGFDKEVQIMKSLDHPNVCRLLETYEQGNTMFLVMELCEGGEVYERIMSGDGDFSEQSAATVVRQCTSALAYSHNKGIAHRDLKPENVCLVSPDPGDDRVKIIDWGLGFFFGQQRMVSAVGSITYTAPEVLESTGQEGYTNACDVWGLGVLTYVMLCGMPPFSGNFMQQLRRMKEANPPMTDATWQAISDDAKDFIKQLLRPNPVDRMTMVDALNHRWLVKPHADMLNHDVSLQIMKNMVDFSKTGQFFSICTATVAKHLDHRTIRDVHRVFSELDEDGDGTLSLQEVQSGFERTYGKDSPEVRNVEEMFNALDIDGSGYIDYTEFCAAAIGEATSLKEETLWAAFKAFDVDDDDGTISKDEIKRVLTNVEVGTAWTTEVCDEVVHGIFEKCDLDQNGKLISRSLCNTCGSAEVVTEC